MQSFCDLQIQKHEYNTCIYMCIYIMILVNSYIYIIIIIYLRIYVYVFEYFTCSMCVILYDIKLR